MSNLLDMPLVLGAIAFLAGYVLAKLGSLIGGRRKEPKLEVTERDRQFRAAEAELRVAQRKLEEFLNKQEAMLEERGEMNAELEILREEAGEHARLLQDAHDQLADECKKTQSLRNELSSRAEEGIRAQVAMREIETELSVVQAGSEVVSDEINRLAAEREELTGRLTSLEKSQKGDDRSPSAASRETLATDLTQDC
jgi:chromosome segregation ATPase